MGQILDDSDRDARDLLILYLVDDLGLTYQAAAEQCVLKGFKGTTKNTVARIIDRDSKYFPDDRIVKAVK